jgi:hypothetical protein
VHHVEVAFVGLEKEKTNVNSVERLEFGTMKIKALFWLKYDVSEGARQGADVPGV